MSQHEFTITRNGKTRKLRVANIVDNFPEGDDSAPSMTIYFLLEVTGWGGDPEWQPLQSVYPQANVVFDGPAIAAAVAAITWQLTNTAAKLLISRNTLAETLARQRWEDS
jgi:hypothetical protein